MNIVDGTITEKNNSSSLYEQSVAFTRDVKQRKQKIPQNNRNLLAVGGLGGVAGLVSIKQRWRYRTSSIKPSEGFYLF